MRFLDDIYTRTLAAVEDAIPLPEDWMTSHTYEATTARALLVHFLEAQGFTRRLTCHYTGLAKSSVKQHINGYHARLKRDHTLRIMAAAIERELKEPEQEGEKKCPV